MDHPSSNAIPGKDSILQFTPDTRYLSGVFEHTDDKPPAILPFLGWAVQVCWTTAPGWADADEELIAWGSAGYATQLRPVFLNGAAPVTAAELLDRDGYTLTELHPAGTPNRAGTLGHSGSDRWTGGDRTDEP